MDRYLVGRVFAKPEPDGGGETQDWRYLVKERPTFTKLAAHPEVDRHDTCSLFPHYSVKLDVGCVRTRTRRRQSAAWPHPGTTGLFRMSCDRGTAAPIAQSASARIPRHRGNAWHDQYRLDGNSHDPSRRDADVPANHRAEGRYHCVHSQPSAKRLATWQVTHWNQCLEEKQSSIGGPQPTE